ncbi:hypothetical protein D3C75_487350 [compost metagenome]
MDNEQEFYELTDPIGYAACRWHEHFDSVIMKDLSKIEFSPENTYASPNEWEGPGVGFQSIGDFNFVGVYAGGDWETPVYYILYIDNKDKVRAYIPTDGNLFNRKLKMAFGSNFAEDKPEYSDEEAVKEQYGVEEDLFEVDLSKYFDWEKVKLDIINRIVVE